MGLNITEDVIRRVARELRERLGPFVSDPGALDWRWLAGRALTAAHPAFNDATHGHPESAFRVKGRIAELVKIGDDWTVRVSDPADRPFTRTPFDDGYAPLRIDDPAELVLTWTPH